MSIIVTGADGMLGSAVKRVLIDAEDVEESRVFTNRFDLDVRSLRSIREFVTPNDIVINCAGVVPDAEHFDATAMVQANAVGPFLLADAAKRLVHISSDHVFDGEHGDYSERSSAVPEDLYGLAKLAGEVAWPPHLTIRCSFIGLGSRGLLSWLLRHPRGAYVNGYSTWTWNGFYVQTLARLIVKFALAPEEIGLMHLHSADVITKYHLLKMISSRIRPDLHVIPLARDPAKHLSLRSVMLPVDDPSLSATWDEMIEELVHDYRDSTSRP